mgnify:CR=1 FL=1|jgi:protein TonB
MALANYRHLALSWQPSHKEDRLFTLFAVAALIIALVIGAAISSIDVPKKSRDERSVVPERVAKFITMKPKPVPPPPPPKVKPPEPPKPVEPKPEPEVKPETPRPRIERERPRPTEPLTTEQQRAREKAAQSGLLAHMRELNDLVEAPEVAAQVRADIRQAGAGDQPTGPDTRVLTSGVNRGSGGVDASRYAASAGDSQLGAAEVAAAREALAASETAFARDAAAEARSGGARTRSEEEITLVFDRHKSQLQSLYNRARRSNPALKGKLVLAVTIRPDGSVSGVKVVSSELQDQALLDSLLARIRTFQFGARDVETATVNYPIEFLPY